MYYLYTSLGASAHATKSLALAMEILLVEPSANAVVPLAWTLFVHGGEALNLHHFEEAERLFRTSASMGEPHAMDSLGTLLCRLGRSQEGVKWYRRAVEAGLPQAAWNLAMHYVPLNQKRRYRYWIHRAAAMGEEDAILEAAKIAKVPEYITKLPLED